MKTPLPLLSALCILTAAFACADNRPADDTAIAVVQSSDAPALTYDTAEYIHAMPRLQGVVLQKFSCCVLMSTEDGTNFWIGSPAATSEVVDYVAAMKLGGSYRFPDAFLAWQEKDKRPESIITAQAGTQPGTVRLLARFETAGQAK